MMNEIVENREKSESAVDSNANHVAVSRSRSRARGCIECRRLHRACQADRVGHACRRCIARFREGMCSLNQSNSHSHSHSHSHSPSSNSIALQQQQQLLTISVDVDARDQSVMDRLARLWLNEALKQQRVDEKPRWDELVVPRICLRFDFVGELLIESVNSSALQLFLGDGDDDDDDGDDKCNGTAGKPHEQIAGMAASRFMRCRTILATSYNLPTKVQSIDGECRMLQLNLPHGAGWTRVHCAGNVQLSESPFDQRMWVRAIYMSILNVFAA